MRRTSASPAALLALFVQVVLVASTARAARGQRGPRPALSPTNVQGIARLVMLEDRRQFDSAGLAQLLDDAHPEVRRRAALAVGRIADRRGMALLHLRPLDRDTAIAATTVFAVGQLRDTSTVAWLDSLLVDSRTAPTVATEAAAALGKLKTAAAREVLARHLATVAATPRTTNTIAEALLSIGRSTARGDIGPIVRWSSSHDEALRWRATWALFRPRDPHAVSTLLTLSADRSALVRSWAVRGLGKVQADSAGLGAPAEQRLIAATRDADRRVRTEALRAIATYNDSSAESALVSALASSDGWISVSGAEGLARIRSPRATQALIGATAAGRPCALRVTAMQSLQALSPQLAIDAAHDIAKDSAPYCHATAVQLIARDTSRPAAQRRADLASADSVVRLAALRVMGSWADSSDLPMLLDLYDRTQNYPSTAVASAAVGAIGAMQRRLAIGAAQFFARFSAPANLSLRRDVDRTFGAAARQAWAAAPAIERGASEYLRIVQQWVVPDYAGRPHPTARWETPRGAIDLELYPGDAPLAVDDFVRTMQSGTIAGTEFTRVVPDFVDQQRTIRDGNILRDEVNRHRLTRGNLAWATAGLDTGTPGYTLNHTPQPHNEGDFTSMGRVIHGMDAVDHIELGDRVTSARMLTGAP